MQFVNAISWWSNEAKTNLKQFITFAIEQVVTFQIVLRRKTTNHSLSHFFSWRHF
jgi:hypothetical protein